jgi:hypothetical protein
MEKQYIKTTVVLALVFAFIPSSAFAYKLKTTESGKHILWSKDKVIIRITPEVEELLGTEDADSSANFAAEAWRGYSNVPDLIAEPGSAEETADENGTPIVGLRVGTPWAYKPNNLAVTVTTYNEVTGQILKADVLLNGSSPFALINEQTARVNKTNKYDIEAVLVHEFGHLLGLQDNDEEPTATMWPIIEPGETSKRSLEEDDQLGVIAAYADGLAPSNGDAQTAIACQQMSVIGFTRRPSNLELSVFSLIVLALARRGMRRSRQQG